MKLRQILEKEAERIGALYNLNILDTAVEEEFDNIVLLASEICKTPVSTISFVDKERTWFKAKLGIDFTEISRANSFSSIALQQDGPMIVKDTLTDERFSHNPLITERGIRFYAGIPIKTEEEFILGHLGVSDYQPRTLTSEQLFSLNILAKQVVKLLKLRQQVLQCKKGEGEAKKSEELLKAVFHKAIDAIIIMDSKGVVVQWNSKAETLFGWTGEEAIGKYFHEITILEPNREAHLKRMEQYQKTGDESILNETIEITAVRKNKTVFDITLGIAPASVQCQRFYIAYVSDITDRKLITTELDKQKDFYETILNKIPTDIAVFDPNHRYLFINPGAIKNEELRKFIIGKDDFEYAKYRNWDESIARKRREKFLQAKSSTKEIRWEDNIKDKDGNTITYLRRMFPVHNEEGELTMVIGFGIDITERKTMEEKQEALVKQLSAQNIQLVDFCNIVSHNLRAPLVNMSMLVQFIEESTDEIEQKQMINMLNPVIENLHTTFNELVESIQIKHNLEIKSEKINLKECLKRTLEGLEMEIKKSQAVIEINFDAAPVIQYPPKYLYSIFHNLLSNSLKYRSPKRKPIIKLETKINEGDIIFSVNDNGLGIDMVRHKDSVFKIGKVLHRHPEAKGFGLYMTKTQVEAMDGRIWVESTPDSGSTFFIEFKNQKV